MNLASGIIASDGKGRHSAATQCGFDRKDINRAFPWRRGRPQESPWPSVPAHIADTDDALVSVAAALERAPRFADLPELSLAEQLALNGFETNSANGRPLGTPDFVNAVERLLGRSVQPAKPGPKPGGVRRQER